MKHVDDELLQALKDSEEQAAAEPTVASVQSSGDRGRVPASRRGSLGLLIGLLVTAGVILTLVLTNVNNSAVYSKDVDQLLSQKGQLKDRTVKVKGMLVKGSLKSNLASRGKKPCEYRFIIHAPDGQTLPVRFGGCVLPDTFRDKPDMDVEATVTGRLAKEGYFAADHIAAKCPSKYEMKQRAAAGEKAPHGAPGNPGPGSSDLPPLGTPLDHVEDRKNSAPVVSGAGKEG